jgi:FG-GAP-like repeat
VDLNADGNIDVLSGSYSRMEKSMAGLFQVMWGKPDGTVAAAEVLNGIDDAPLIVSAPEGGEGYDSDIDRICTRPVAVDWDSDGDLDLVVGDFGGKFHLFHGEGDGRFQPTSGVLMVGDDVLRIAGHHSDPFCIDWDGDGDIDLLSGSTNGGVQLAENTAGPGKTPKLKRFVSLIDPSPQDKPGGMMKESDLKAPTRSTRIWVDDVNKDGKLDVLVGDSTTLTSPAEGLTESEADAKATEWQEQVTELSKQIAALNEPNDLEEDAVEERQQKFYAELSKLYQERSQFITEDRTGFVWLYLQK